MKKWKLLGKRAAAFLLGAVMAVNPGLAGTAAESLLGIVSYAEERTASAPHRQRGDRRQALRRTGDR